MNDMTGIPHIDQLGNVLFAYAPVKVAVRFEHLYCGMPGMFQDADAPC